MERQYKSRAPLHKRGRIYKNCLGKKKLWGKSASFFEMAEGFPPLMQSNVREPGANPGRLRHCDGYKFQSHCKCGKAE